MSVELIEEPIDVMLRCSAHGVVDPVRLMWRKREIRIEPKPARPGEPDAGLLVPERGWGECVPPEVGCKRDGMVDD